MTLCKIYFMVGQVGLEPTVLKRLSYNQVGVTNFPTDPYKVQITGLEPVTTRLSVGASTN